MKRSLQFLILWVLTWQTVYAAEVATSRMVVIQEESGMLQSAFEVLIPPVLDCDACKWIATYRGKSIEIAAQPTLSRWKGSFSHSWFQSNGNRSFLLFLVDKHGVVRKTMQHETDISGIISSQAVWFLAGAIAAAIGFFLKDVYAHDRAASRNWDKVKAAMETELVVTTTQLANDSLPYTQIPDFSTRYRVWVNGPNLPVKNVGLLVQASELCARAFEIRSTGSYDDVHTLLNQALKALQGKLLDDK